ncbi:MAG: HU family DNA-binding protein [Deltaproteobacteria bacterium]|jgi:integration host factor subunit alpha|nr:HU family DNA-binding protein [Deltaproteobacteria bacterium]
MTSERDKTRPGGSGKGPPPLTRAEIVRKLHDRLSISSREAGRILEAVIACLSETLAEGRPVTIAGLGRFCVRDTPARPGRNPRTGAYAQVPGRRRPCFSMSRELRERMLRSLPEPPAPMGPAGGAAPGGPAPPDAVPPGAPVPEGAAPQGGRKVAARGGPPATGVPGRD